MEEEDFAIFLGDFLDFLNNVEESISRMKQQIAKLVGAVEEWNVVSAPKPVSPEDRAIKWLEKKLEALKERHRAIRYEFLTDTGGLITGLRYLAEDEEQKADVEALARWAFEKAASKPDLQGETRK